MTRWSALRVPVAGRARRWVARALLVAGVVAGWLAGLQPLRAQSCHRVSGPESSAQGEARSAAGHHLQIGATAEAATLDGGDYHGDYQGLSLSAMWHYDWAGVGLSMPFYRLRLGSDRVLGPGDLMLQGHARLLGDAANGAGLMIDAGLPTGSAGDSLGMGHVMLMGGVFGTMTFDMVNLLGSMMVASAVDPGAPHHHAADVAAGTAPAVNPMNELEFAATLRATLSIAKQLEVYAVGLLAVPIVKDGMTRGAAGPGVLFSLEGWSLSAEVQFGLAGDPFGVRGLLGAAYAFHLG